MNGRWPRLAVAIIGTGILGWASLSHAIVTVTHARNPNVALRVDGQDPVALVGKAQLDLSTKPSRKNAQAAIEASRASIRELALNSPGFQLLGFAGQGFENSDKIGERVAFSGRLSRRSLRTHLWLVEEAVRRNDVAGALEQYDLALRSNPSSQSLLFPALTRAMDEPVIRRRFMRYMESPPPWLQAFLRTALASSTNPKSLAELAQEAGGLPEGPEYEPFNAEVIRRLADAGDYAAAVEFYRQMSGNSAAVLATAQMTVASSDTRYSPITWQPYVIDGMDAAFVSAGGDAVQLAVDLESTFTGPIARKILTLSPGRYTLAIAHEAERPGPFSRVTWRLACAGSCAPTFIFDKSEPVQQRTVVRGSFEVSPACPVQMLSLDATSGVETGSLNLLVGPVQLSRAN